MGLPIVYLISLKWQQNPHVKKLEKNIVGMGMHRNCGTNGKN
jgi:hypothetical protein